MRRVWKIASGWYSFYPEERLVRGTRAGADKQTLKSRRSRVPDPGAIGASAARIQIAGLQANAFDGRSFPGSQLGAQPRMCWRCAQVGGGPGSCDAETTFAQHRLRHQIRSQAWAEAPSWAPEWGIPCFPPASTRPGSALSAATPELTIHSNDFAFCWSARRRVPARFACIIRYSNRNTTRAHCSSEIAESSTYF